MFFYIITVATMEVIPTEVVAILHMVGVLMEVQTPMGPLMGVPGALAVMEEMDIRLPQFIYATPLNKNPTLPTFTTKAPGTKSYNTLILN